MIELPAELPGPDAASQAAVAERAAQVLRPSGAFARLDEVAAWLAGWQATTSPTAERCRALIFVAEHGVAQRGVSAYPASVTAEMLRALRSGAATAAVMARSLGVELDVVDVGVGEPTGDLVVEDALTDERFEAAFEAGRATADEASADILVFGEMGIGNTTAASAVCASLFGMPAEEWTGRGTGVDDAGLAHKTDVVRSAAGRIEGAPPLEVLRRVGGAELAAIAGATLQARLNSTPVVLDGFVATAAVAALEAASPGALDHCIAGHCSEEAGHRLLLEKLGKRPLLDLGLRLGEGSGALAALPLIRLAAACVTDVATFEEWGLA